MNKILFPLLPLVFTCFIGIAQTYAPLSTPKGSLVEAYTLPELSNGERANLDGQYSSPNRVQYIITGNYSSSGKFNCHGYAWSIAEAGPIRWIGYYSSSEENIYMTDGSYIKVCSETYPGKVSWGSNDHSAITTSTSGRWKSKWGSAPLMVHDWNDNPYGTTNLNYYVETKIRGVDPFICGSNTYSVPSFTGGTYSWISSSNISLNTTSQNSVVASSSTNGSGWVEVVITSPCNSTSVTTRLNVTIGPSIGAMTMPQTYFYGGSANVYAEVPMVAGAGYYDYEWYLDGSFQQMSAYNHEFTFYGCGSHYLGVRANTGACGWTDFSYGNFYVDCSGGYSAVSISPNPSTDFLNVVISQPEAGIKSTAVGTVTEYEVTLYDNKGDLRRNGYTISGKLRMDTRELPDGIYYLLVPHGDKIVSKQLIIKH